MQSGKELAGYQEALPSTTLWVQPYQHQPPLQHRIDHSNYKGFFSINMQAICDSNGRFLDISVGYPGSVHDTHQEEQ